MVWTDLRTGKHVTERTYEAALSESCDMLLTQFWCMPQTCWGTPRPSWAGLICLCLVRIGVQPWVVQQTTATATEQQQHKHFTMFAHSSSAGHIQKADLQQAVSMMLYLMH